jgi:hypothetical protein
VQAVLDMVSYLEVVDRSLASLGGAQYANRDLTSVVDLVL